MMKKGGTGGFRTVTGLYFEKRVSLKAAIQALPDYHIKQYEVFYKSEKVAELYPKHGLYKKLLEPKGIDCTKVITKKLLPDDAIFILRRRTLFIVEIKFQEVAGSVDEKLQTCDFKNKQYQKLLSPLGISVKYVYVLCDWFKDARYEDVLDYIQSVGCYYFFNELPLDFLGLPVPGK